MAQVFAQEFKDQIVEVFRQGDRTVQDIAKEFNLSPTTVSNWVRASENAQGRLLKGGTSGSAASDKAEIARLRRELARKQEELEILGKALAFFAQRRDR
jgi:transposase